jgi:hypothetical protein
MSYVQRRRRALPAGLAAGLLCAVLALVLLSACSESLPAPPTGPIPSEAWIEVPYPPPPARVETVPPPPQGGSREVWLDGQWDWVGDAWRWAAGAWMTPPANAYFTPWQTVRGSDGRLFFAPAAWRGKDGRPLDVGAGRDACPGAPAPQAGEVAR